LRPPAGWFDAFFILRPTLFFPAWTAFLAGYRLGDGSAGRAALYLLWLAAASGASFLLNQLTDRREDCANGKLLPLWDGLVTRGMLRLEMAFLLTGTILGAAWAGGEAAGWLALFFIIAGWLYNFPPFRLKSRPLLGIAACAAGGWILVVIGARAAGLPLDRAALAGLPYALAGAAASLLTHVPDLAGDRATGARTFPLVYGLAATGAWAAGLTGAAAATALLLHDWALFAAAAVSLPFFLRFSFRQDAAAAQSAVKIAVFSLAVAVGLAWPPLLVMIALYYPFARWYHRARLGLEYPSFGNTPPTQD